MKKLLAVAACAILALSLFAMPASAAGMRGQDAPAAQYTSEPPEGSAATSLILYENFDGCASPEAAGFFATTQEKETETTYYEYPDCEIALSTEHAHSGSRSLKVFHRDLVDNSTKGHHTFIYKGTNDSNTLGALIAANYKGSSPQTDTYFFRAWVYSDTPQTFMFQMQYGGTLEFWAPNDDYYEVPAKTWTLIGGYQQDGVIYYSSMLEDFGACGVYPPRAASTWTGLKATTRNKDQVNTWGDYYVDDIALWKVTDNTKLFNYNKDTKQIEDLNGKRATTTTTKAPTTTTKAGDTSENSETSEVSEVSEVSENSVESTEPVNATTAKITTTTAGEPTDDSNGAGLGWVLWAIIGGAVVIAGGVVAVIFLTRKKGDAPAEE